LKENVGEEEVDSLTTEFREDRGKGEEGNAEEGDKDKCATK